jgi:hypothetical protein
VLTGGELLIGSNPGSDKCRQANRWASRIHQAKTYRLKERPRVVQSTHGLAIEVPFLRASLMKFRIVHCLIKPQTFLIACFRTLFSGMGA